MRQVEAGGEGLRGEVRERVDARVAVECPERLGLRATGRPDREQPDWVPAERVCQHSPREHRQVCEVLDQQPVLEGCLKPGDVEGRCFRNVGTPVTQMRLAGGRLRAADLVEYDEHLRVERDALLGERADDALTGTARGQIHGVPVDDESTLPHGEHDADRTPVAVGVLGVEGQAVSADAPAGLGRDGCADSHGRLVTTGWVRHPWRHFGNALRDRVLRRRRRRRARTAPRTVLSVRGESRGAPSSPAVAARLSLRSRRSRPIPREATALRAADRAVGGTPIPSPPAFQAAMLGACFWNRRASQTVVGHRETLRCGLPEAARPTCGRLCRRSAHLFSRLLRLGRWSPARGAGLAGSLGADSTAAYVARSYRPRAPACQPFS